MVLGEEESVLFREVSLFQGCPYRGAPLYTYIDATTRTSCRFYIILAWNLDLTDTYMHYTQKCEYTTIYTVHRVYSAHR